jgi:membrane peptidoglycan carboxypeptidase
MKELLRAVVERGTGEAGAIPGLELAGKTGTSSKARDSWFVGYSERGVVAVWVGFDDNRPLPRGGGASTALPIWRQVVLGIHSGNHEGGEVPTTRLNR